MDLAVNISLTLISSTDWNKNQVVLQNARKFNSVMKYGQLFACCERFGGNTLNLTYPYFHLTSEPFVIKERLRDAIAFTQSLPPSVDAKLDQAAYEEIDRYSFSHSKLVLTNSEHLIFMGLRINERQPDLIESQWKTWSKIEMLTDSLERTGLAIDGVTCLKQIVPNNYSLFMYCFMVSIEIKSDQQKLKCLNVLQRLRGSLVPGYISLFERSKGLTKKTESRTRSIDSLDYLIDGVDIRKPFDEYRLGAEKKHRRETRSVTYSS